MSGILNVLVGSSYFTPVTNTYTTGTSATETIPVLASSVVIEVFGAGGAGGAYSTLDSIVYYGGGGGGSGGYSIKTASVVGSGGLTMTYSVGALGTTTVGTGNAGTGSNVVSGTFSLTTISTNGGAGGTQVFGSGGLGGAAGASGSGGDTNSAGNAGTAGTISTNGVGGAGKTGTNGNGLAGGDGAYFPTPAQAAGGTGKIIFSYT